MNEDEDRFCEQCGCLMIPGDASVVCGVCIDVCEQQCEAERLYAADNN